MQNSGGAKPKQKNTSHQKHQSEANNQNYNYGSQHSQNYCRTLSALSEPDEQKYKTDTNVRKKSITKQGKGYVKINNKTDHDQFAADLKKNRSERNYSSSPQQKVNNNIKVWERIQSPGLTDDIHSSHISNSSINSLSSMNLQKSQTDRILYCTAPRNEIIHQNCYQAYQNYRKITIDKVQMATDCFSYSKSNNMLCPSPFQDSRIRKYPECSHYERLKYLKSSFLKTFDQQMKMKEREIAQSINDDIKEILKVHLSMLDRKKDTYNKQIENILNQQMQSNQINLIQKKFDRCNCALMEKRWLSAYRQDILQALTMSQVLIITGEMGYGKSTLLPLYAAEICSEMGTVVSCHPFHVTVITIANHLTKMLGTSLGKHVGYKLAKDQKVSSNTNIVFMTYHCLLKETVNSPFLSMYSCIILDDFENRSVEADIFLCKIKEILQQRPNFKLILIGSYPDERFEKFFDTGEKVTVISLPKITFPVNTFWNNLRNPSLYIEKAVELIKSINLQKKSGNVIVFLSTMQETQKACALVEEKLQNEVLCFSFHSKTNYDEIVKLYSSNPKRKIIFSTECAESSINLPNICFVIDSGKVKENIYNAEKQQSTISSSFISKERAERRKQLAGQIQNGCCYRLYTESIYLREMIEKSFPLISKMNPANIVLTLLYYKIPVPSNANFICPLEKEVLQAGSLVLKNIGAVKDSTLTKLGKTMALMTFELKHAKLVALGIEKGFSFETIIIALLSSLNTPIFNTVGKSKDIGKHRFFNPDGDYFAIFNVYLNWKKENFAEDWCKANGINHSSLTSLHKKVTEMMAVLNVKVPHPQNIKSHKKLIELICDCFHDNLCVYSGHFILGYKSLNTGNFLRIHSSSTFSYRCDNPPQYIVYDYAIEHGNIDFVINVTPVPDDIIKTMLKNPEMVKESNQGCAMNSVVIEPVGEMFIKRELLGKQGKKLKILEDEIKKNINCDSVVIDPNADNGKIEIYTYSEYLNSAKETLLKHLRAYLEKLKNQEEEAHIPTGNVLMKVSWGQGGIITKISGTVNKYTLQEKVANEEESFCSVMHNYSINLTWIRRLCKGMGFVTFSCESDFDRACSSLLSSELKIHEKEVRVTISKKAPNQIFIEDLLPQTSNEDLKEAVENSIHFSVASATIVCSPPFTTSQDDIEIMKNILLLQYLGYVQDGNLSIHIETPNSTDTNMKAYLNVDNITDLTLLLNAIERDGLKTFQDIPIKYKPVYRTTIVCVPEHYNSVKTNIEKSLGIEKKEIFQNFKFSIHFVNGKTQLKLLTNDYNVMQKTEKIIMDILRGEKLRNFNINQLRKLFSHSGQQWLKQAEKATKCYILKNSEQKTLSVCGTRESCDNIVRKIDNYLNNTENEIVSVINIGEKGFSRQVIKTLLLKYGVTLNKFIIECNLISVEFNVQYGQLTLYGTSSSIIKAEKELEILANQSRNLPSVDENEEICPVCLTVPTCGSSHRLEYCGHLYCTDCLKLLVVEKLLPLKCCKENCQEELVIEDILDTLEGNEKETEQLLHHSLNVYVEKNCKHVKYCPTPDCNMIYDLRSLASLQNSDLWTCPACMKVVCTRCNIKEHPGISCDIAKNMKNDVDYSLKIWMTKELNLRKCCPNCKSPIEKSGGCNHMTCQKCEKHFCWLCLEIFRDGNLVYNHLPYCSKNQRPYI